MKEKIAKSVPYDNNLKGRIGGNPPKLIEKLIPDQYVFYATLVHPEKDKVMISILIHENFEVLLEKNIYPNIAITIIEHEYSEQGEIEEKRIKDISVNSISNYSEEEIGNNDFFLVKVGGEPLFIQHKDFYYKELESNDYFYLLQIDEEGYSKGFAIENYVFSFGSLYLYKHHRTNEVVAGFWQYS